MERILTAKEVAKMLQLSIKTVYRMALERRIPCIRISERGTVRFDETDIQGWIDSRKRKPSDASQNEEPDRVLKTK